MPSPQHWSQKSEDPSGTYCTIQHDSMTLRREKGKIQRKINLDRDNNCGFIHSTPNYHKYNKLVNAVDLTMEQEQILSKVNRPNETEDN